MRGIKERPRETAPLKLIGQKREEGDGKKGKKRREGQLGKERPQFAAKFFSAEIKIETGAMGTDRKF